LIGQMATHPFGSWQAKQYSATLKMRFTALVEQRKISKQMGIEAKNAR